MTEYEYALQVDRSSTGWKLSAIVDEMWYGSLEELLNAISDRSDDFEAMTYRIAKRPVKEDLEVLE